MKKFLTVLLIILGIGLFATEQAKDRISYNNNDLFLTSGQRISPLEHYLKKTYSKSPFNYSDTKIGISTGLWRGYITDWEIKRKKLYLTKIEVAHTGLSINLKKMFNKVKKGKVFASWFSGKLLITPGRFEYDTKYIITVENGIITHEQELYSGYMNEFNYDKIENTRETINELYKSSSMKQPSEYREDGVNKKGYNTVCEEIRKVVKQGKENESKRKKQMYARIDSFNFSYAGYYHIDDYVEIRYQRIGVYKLDYDIESIYTNGKLNSKYCIDELTWANPIINSQPQYTWEHFIEYLDELKYCLDQNVWFTKLVDEYNWHLELIMYGTSPELSWKSLEYWNKAGLRGKPDISLLIRWDGNNFGDEMGYIHFSSSESVVLLEPKTSHSYHYKMEFFDMIPYFKKHKIVPFGDEFYLIDSKNIPLKD